MTDIKQLLKAFERYAYGQSLHTAFTNCLIGRCYLLKSMTVQNEQQHALETYQNHPKVNN
jgi:hypothetical protein